MALNPGKELPPAPQRQSSQRMQVLGKYVSRPGTPRGPRQPCPATEPHDTTPCGNKLHSHSKAFGQPPSCSKPRWRPERASANNRITYPARPALGDRRTRDKNMRHEPNGRARAEGEGITTRPTGRRPTQWNSKTQLTAQNGTAQAVVRYLVPQ